jgi:hypothetical protein
MSRNGLYIQVKNTEECREEYKTKYTITRKLYIGEERRIYYKELNDCIIVPPRSVPGSNKIPKTFGVKRLRGLKMLVDPKPDQQVILDQVKPILKSEGGVTIVADTGIGKTFLGIALSIALRYKTLYIVYDEKALDQARAEVVRFSNAKVGLYYGKKKEDGDIVIGIINSILKAPEEFFNFGTVIYDEVTEYVSQKRLEIYFKANTINNIALTADPEKHGFEQIFIDCVGPLLICENKEGVHFVGEVWKQTYKPKTVIRRDDHVDFIATLKAFEVDDERTTLVLNGINKLLNLGKNVICFSEIISYLDFIRFRCDTKSAKLVGGCCEEDREDAKTTNLIFTTYRYGEKCLSYKHIDASVYMTPRRSAKQSSGRIVRRDGDSSKMRIIFDIVDTCFYQQFKYRSIAYKERGFVIKRYL